MSGHYHAAIIVAHPDDEALWFGGTLIRLRNAGAQITIVSVTNAGNDIRRRELDSVAGILGARPVMFDLPDGGGQQLPDFSELLDSTFKDIPDLVLTHASHGNERGHFQHRQCWLFVRRWAHHRRCPMAVFIEKALPRLPGEKYRLLGRGVYRANLHWALRHIGSGARQALKQLLSAEKADSCPGMRPAWTGAVEMAIEIDLGAKKDLLALYGSQIDGIGQYAMYESRMEYVRFFEVSPAERFQRLLLST